MTRCDLFVGLVGSRYGWVPSQSDIPDLSEYDWVLQYDMTSVTELEMHLAMSRKNATENCFFYFRNDSFQKYVQVTVFLFLYAIYGLNGSKYHIVYIS